jgi:hypothetical protein
VNSTPLLAESVCNYKKSIIIAVGKSCCGGLVFYFPQQPTIHNPKKIEQHNQQSNQVKAQTIID